MPKAPLHIVRRGLLLWLAATSAWGANPPPFDECFRFLQRLDEGAVGRYGPPPPPSKAVAANVVPSKPPTLAELALRATEDALRAESPGTGLDLIVRANPDLERFFGNRPRRWTRSALQPPPAAQRAPWIAALHAQRKMALHGEQYVRIRGLGLTEEQARRGADSFFDEEPGAAMPPPTLAALPTGFAAFATAYAEWTAREPKATAAYYATYLTRLAALPR